MPIVSKTTYSTIKCPDYGKLLLLPYISSNALLKFPENPKDVKASFIAMLKLLVKKGTRGLSTLTDMDIDCIGFYYVKWLKTEKAYKTAKERGKSPSEAFAIALKTSEVRKRIQLATEIAVGKDLGLTRSTQEIFRMNRAMKQMAKNLANMSSFEHIVRGVHEQMHFIDQVVRDASVWVSVKEAYEHNILAQVSKYNLLAESARAWQSHWLELAETAKLPKSVFSSHQNAIASLAIRFQSIADIARPLIGVQQQILKAAELSKTIYSDMSKVAYALKATDLAIARSVKFVINTNEYFAAVKGIQSLVPRSIVSRSARNKEHIEELEKGESSLFSTAIESEKSLHIRTAGIISQGNDLLSTLKESVGGVFDEKLGRYENLLKRMEILAHPASLLNLIETFAAAITKDYTTVFWQEPGKKFVAHPETLAKSHLGVFLNGVCGGVAFVGQEIASGNGFVDILANFLGYDYILELKMVGASWSIGWVLSGLDQLNNHMHYYEQKESYLVVFDGRKTTKGKQLENFYDLSNGRVHVVTVRLYLQ